MSGEPSDLCERCGRRAATVLRVHGPYSIRVCQLCRMLSALAFRALADRFQGAIL